MLIAGIAETREVIRRINKQFGYDLGNHSLTALRIKLAALLNKHHLKFTDVLWSRLNDEPGFFEVCLHHLLAESTEMFRDTDLWRRLMQNIIPEALNKKGGLSVCFLESVSGDELYSFQILSKEYGLNSSLQISTGLRDAHSMEIIRNGMFNITKIETSDKNYRSAGGKHSLSRYLNMSKYSAQLDTELIEGICFHLARTLKEMPEKQYDLVFFRNKLVNYKPAYSKEIMTQIDHRLRTGGMLLLGYLNRIDHRALNTVYHSLDQDEGLYKNSSRQAARNF